MPIYDFHCESCGKTFEAQAHFGEVVRCQCAAVAKRLPCASASHVWKPGQHVESPRKPWAGKPHREG